MKRDSSSEKRGPLRKIAIAAAILVSLALVTVTVFHANTILLGIEARERYQSLAEKNRARTQSRPTPQGVQWKDGDAYKLYRRAAEELLELDKELYTDHQELNGHNNRISAAAMVLRHVVEKNYEPERKEAAPTCDSMGLAAKDPMGAVLLERDCKTIEKFLPLLDHIHKAAQTGGKAGPMAIWEPWSIDDQTRRNLSTIFLKLNAVATIDAYLSMKTDMTEGLRKLMRVAIFSVDYSRGGTIVESMLTTSLLPRQIILLAHLLRHDSLDVAQLEMVLAQTAFLDKLFPTTEEVFETNAIDLSRHFFDPDDIDNPPNLTEATAMYQNSFYLQYRWKASANVTMIIWEKMLETHRKLPYTKRNDRYEDIVMESRNEMAVRAMDGHSMKYDRDWQVNRTRWRMLGWGAAVRLAQHKGDDAGLTIAKLKERHSELLGGTFLNLDPKMTIENGEIELVAGAIDHPDTKSNLEGYAGVPGFATTLTLKLPKRKQ